MSTEVKAWKCEKCGKAFLSKIFANECCEEKVKVIKTCRVCGCVVADHHLICQICLDQERFEKAKKVKYSDYKVGYLWDESKDQYFKDKEALEEKYEEDAEDYEGEGAVPEFPTWCYGCTETFFSIDIDSAIERGLEDMYEDFDDIDDEKELQDFVKAWNAKQNGVTYNVDYSTVVLLNE